MVNGNNRIIYGAMGTLAVAFILGGVGLAVGQSAMDERVKICETVQRSNAEAVKKIPVILNEIEHIKSDIEDIDKKQDEILKAIRGQK